MKEIKKSMEQKRLGSRKDSDENHPGFKKLEVHSKPLILNASNAPPFDIAASTPTEFLSQFLEQKNVYNANMVSDHHLKKKEVDFNPTQAFCTTIYLY